MCKASLSTSSIAMSEGQWESKVTPAQLSFLAIYNPSLGPTDETFRDQILYYYSRPVELKDGNKKKRSTKAKDDVLKEAENERLRQVGLAQGMVDFARYGTVTMLQEGN